MDLLDFSDCELYFDVPMPAAAEQLLAQASAEYGDPSAETALLRAHLLAPENLTVLVGLYRYYFYQHRLDDALQVAERAMQLSGHHLDLPDNWERLDEAWLAHAAAKSFGLLRFYLLALKAASVVLLRLGRIDDSRRRLQKLSSLDSRDQLGTARLLEVVAIYESPATDEETPSTDDLALA